MTPNPDDSIFGVLQGLDFFIDLSLQVLKNDNIAYRIEYMHAFIKIFICVFEKDFFSLKIDIWLEI